MAVAPSTPSRPVPEVVGVLCGLAALGHAGIAQAIGQAQQQTGLGLRELGMRLGLSPEALVLWAQGSFIPRAHHLMRLGEVLADHQPQPPGPPNRPD